jgi:hypothetical protein
MEWYGVDVDLADSTCGGDHLNHPIAFGSMTSGHVNPPLHSIRASTYGGRHSEPHDKKWGKRRFPLNGFDLKDYRYAYVGSDDCPCIPDPARSLI